MTSTASDIKKRKQVLQKQPVTDTQVKQTQDAQQFISAREKAKSKGATQREATSIANEQTADIGTDKYDPEAVKLANQPLATSEIQPLQKLSGNTETGALNPESGVAKTNLGQSFIAKAYLNNLSPELAQKLADEGAKMRAAGLTPEQYTSDIQEQNLLKLGLNDIDVQTLADGEAKVSLLSQEFEGIPIVGKIQRWVGALSTPSNEVDGIMKSLGEANTQISTSLANAKANPARASEYLQQVKDFQTTIIKGESKIKLLTLQSPELRSNPEEIIGIQAKMLGIKQNAQDTIEQLNLIK